MKKQATNSHVPFKFRLIKIIVLFVSLMFMGLSAKGLIVANPLNDDGLANLKLAYSLAHDNTMGITTMAEGKRIVKPSNAREPVPNWITAQWIKLNPILMNDAKLDERQSIKQLLVLKKVNVLVLVLMLLGVYVLAYDLLAHQYSPSLRFGLALATLWLTYACVNTAIVSTMITEVHGSLLIIWSTWALIRLHQELSWRYAILAGLLLGLLVLTKAAFAYVLCVWYLALLGFFVWQRNSNGGVITGFKWLALGVSVTVVVAPWMLRNANHLGTFEIAARGPNVLLTRAYKSQMTDEEFKGAFYAYAPASLKKPMKYLTGFEGKDRLLGGRLQRFTRFFPEDEACRSKGDEACAVGYYIRASIRYNNIMRDFQEKYPNQPKLATLMGERAAKAYAIALIKNNPWGHLKTSLVFAWRGAWPCNKVDGRWLKSEQRLLQPAWQEILPFFGLLSMFGLAVMSVIKQKVEWAIFTWLGCFTFCFYALATHFIPRYSIMMIPLWVLSSIYCMALILSRLKEKSTS